MKRSWIAHAGLFVWALSAAAHGARPTAIIDGRATQAAVTPHLYGMFIEPIGPLVARGLWAEMLDDRKFYYPIVPEARDTPEPPSPEGRPSRTWRKWRPIGPGTAVGMDPREPFVGAQSVQVTLDGSGPRGIGQSGIGLARGRRYVGHLVFAGDPGVSVEVALVWGDAPGQRRAVSLPRPGAAWTSADFDLTAGIDTATARFEITGSGTGRLRLGVVSLMPADNVNGWRADTTSLLRTLDSGFWRLPGGNFLSNWDWHGALGPRDRRAPMFDHAWKVMQPNDIGMDEWMELTRLLGVEPYVSVNAGLGDANSAAEEVQYLNGPATSMWGGQRAANGHPAPYGVRYWNIGNEPYGEWQIGRTTLDYYLIKHRAFAAAMRAADPSIVLLGSGTMPDQIQSESEKSNPTLADMKARLSTDRDWSGALLEKAAGTFDGLTEHWYDRAEERPGAPRDAELIEFTRSASNRVRMKADIWGLYAERFADVRAGKVFMSMDEYAVSRTPANLKSALAYALVLQEMLRHTRFLKMAALTTGTSTLDVTPNDATLNTTGLVYKLYGERFGAGTVPLAVDGDVPQPAPRYVVGFDHPQARAGSATYPLDVVAALSADGRTLRIGVVNPTYQAQTLSLVLRNLRIRGTGAVWRLTGASPDAVNKVGAVPGVKARRTPVPAFRNSATVPSISISVFEYPVEKR